MSPESPHLQEGQPTFVAIHGVGRQLELATIRTLIEGSHQAGATVGRYSRAQLADLRKQFAPLIVDDAGRKFAEVRYSQLIDAHSSYSERDLKLWLRTFLYFPRIYRPAE
ncbi:MAG: hypothetical protein J0I06_03460 [Planctomycetes bacterium]|nr:hypothetical protein [Planctomycetota bacterium]